MGSETFGGELWLSEGTEVEGLDGIGDRAMVKDDGSHVGRNVLHTQGFVD